jgi:hypothetical protein
VTVKARDIWGSSSPWSEPLMVTITDNTPPEPPTIDGPASIKPMKTYLYTISTTDLQNQDVKYDIDWGDGNGEYGKGPYPIDQEVPLQHAFAMKGTFVIKVRAVDIAGGESEWSTLEISCARTRASTFYALLQELLERFPNAFPMLRQLFGL